VWVIVMVGLVHFYIGMVFLWCFLSGRGSWAWDGDMRNYSLALMAKGWLARWWVA